jgi:hypothetical protein
MHKIANCVHLRLPISLHFIMNIYLNPLLLAVICGSTVSVGAQKPANCNLGTNLNFNLKVFVERVQTVNDYAFRSSDCSNIEGELLVVPFDDEAACSLSILT